MRAAYDDRCRMRPAPRTSTLALAFREGRARGFTLVELMIVVVIVGVLSMMAVAGYSKLFSSSHMAEATHMVNAIRVAQEAYKAESGSYANISTALAANQATNHGALYPHSTMAAVKEPGNYKVGWGAACTTGCNADWRTLPVHADGSTMFGYTTVAGLAGEAPTQSVSINGSNVTWPASIPSDWFLITAVGDTNGNGTFCTVLGTSFTNDLLIDKDGE